MSQSNYHVDTQENVRNNSHSFVSGSSSRRHNPIDVVNSNLDTNAQEFYPAGQNNGAIRKTQQTDAQRPNRRNFRPGSGRTFSARNGYYNRNYDRNGDNRNFSDRNGDNRNFADRNGDNRNFSRNNDERKRALEETKKFLDSTQSNSDNNVDDRGTSQSSDYLNQNKPEVQYNKPLRNNNDGYNRNYGRNYYGRNDNKYRNHENNYYESGPSTSYDKNNADSTDRYSQRNYKKYDNKSDNRSSAFYDKSNADSNEKYAQKNNKFDRKYDNKHQYDKSRNNYKQNRNSYKDRYSKENKEIRLNKKLDAASQRERLEQMLNRKMLECLVCCEMIKNNDKIWTCTQCYHILHLNCVSAWAKSSKVETSWRCPACQNHYTDVPRQYRCYCGKTVEPRPEPGIIPHGCGDVCLRKGRTCDHNCTILCHPGPCPDCSVMVAKPCGCGKTEPIVKCSADIELVCDSTCDKLLECGLHQCKAKCHSGDCSPCDQFILQECYCGKLGRKVPCTAEYNGSTHFECDDVCEKVLSCGNHKCKKKCHEGECDSCERDLNVKFCPCGKTPLAKRNSCLDPIPCCGKVCGRKLRCGQPSNPHACQSLCHEGECPPCGLKTMVRCRCGHMDKEMPCKELTTKADDARCEKKCTKKRLCGKHRCNQRCCIEVEHFCPLPCNHQLSCGQHRCERTCHSGRCAPCMETSFDELYCECGASVYYPPVPCGTKPPPCDRMCSRTSPCGHPMTHTCHTGPCPPCAVLVKRWCHGHHEQRSAIPCHQTEFSCGLPCGKPMPCGRHKCIKPCHAGECPLPCKQPCTAPRPTCGHSCNKPCHESPCPNTLCRQPVTVTCPCGLQKSQRPCNELVDEYRNWEMAKLREKMGEMSNDQPVDISDIVQNTKRPSVLKILECTEECKVLERNRRLAIGLQIRNPDISQKLAPKYSDYMKQWAKKDPTFCQRIHDKLTDLVQLAKQSKQKSRAHSFEVMNRDKRHFIHEYCEHFGVESAAYDMEPNRNVVATAIKDKSWLPSVSLLEFVQRENGLRKVPKPMLSKSSLVKSETVSLKLPSRAQRPATPPGEMIDYFDNPPV